MLVICVVGMPASGKTIVIDKARKLGIPVIVMGDVVREEAARRGMPLTPSNLNLVAKDLRVKEGKDAIAKRCLEKIRALNTDVIAIDGVRSLEELNYFRKHLGVTIIIAVHASPKTRFQRIINRNRPGDPRTWKEFVERDMVELGFGLGNVIALADYMIINEERKEDAEKKADEILRKLLRHKNIVL